MRRLASEPAPVREFLGDGLGTDGCLCYIRLMMASVGGERKMRGLSPPGCALPVTALSLCVRSQATSTRGRASADLSMPAASPTGWEAQPEQFNGKRRGTAISLRQLQTRARCG